MIPEALVYVFTAIGVACLSNLFLLRREYKAKANKHVQDETIRFLLSDSTKEFTKNLKAKEVTLDMVSDFYTEFIKTYRPSSLFRKTWNYFLIAGTLFILSAILACCFQLPDFYSLFTAEVNLVIALYPIAFAITFLIRALYDLYRLDKILP